MIVAVAAGGTGGHFYPGLAIAKELKKRGHQIYFIVRKNDYVLPLLHNDGIASKTIAAGGFRRKWEAGHLLTIIKLIQGFFQSIFIFLGNKPNIFLAMGGYLSFPPALAARLLGIPVYLHEQNVVPGLANRLLARISKRVFLSFEESKRVFGEKGVVMGNPVRPEFGQLEEAGEARTKFSLSPQKKTLLVFGGSLGARGLNKAVVETLDGMGKLAESWQILHVTGENDLAFVRDAYRKLPFTTFATSFCHNMMEAYAACDFIVCRSGASTLSELIVTQRPALLVPYPWATNNHQSANARVLEDAGCCVRVEEKPLDKQKFSDVLRQYLENDGKRETARKNYERVNIRPLKAAALIADHLEATTSSPAKSS